MFKLDPTIAKETLIHVIMGTVVNYPLNILFTWILLDKMGVTDPIKFATITTVWFSIVAFTRIYVVRVLTERHKAKRADKS